VPFLISPGELFPDPVAAHPVQPVRLPRDELTHDFPVEWWYFAGHLAAGDERMSYMITAIRGTKWLLPPATVSVVKRVDHARGPLPLQQAGLAFGLAYHDTHAPVSYTLRYSGSVFNLWYASPDSWQIDGEPGRYRIRLWDHDRQPELDLMLAADGPAVLLGTDGVVDYGAGHQLAYWLRPKMTAQGFVRIGGSLRTMRGPAWYERQWGNAPTDAYAWKYVNVALDDGEQWIAYHTRLGTAERWYAARMPASGGLEPLPLDAAGFANVAMAGRPLGTDLRVACPDGETVLRVRPLFPEERDIESIYPGVPPFWESVCRVEGTRGGRPVRGWSMTELHGYE
jgi:predicted secreted hydrolase